MEKNLLGKDALTIMNELRQKTLASPREALSIIKTLQNAPRHKTDRDYAFALKVQEIFALAFMGRHEKFRDTIKWVYDELTKLTDLNIYLEACGRLAPVYYELGDMNKCVSLFSSICERESELEVYTLRSASACVNLGLIYQEYGRKNESEYYFSKESEILDSHIILEELTSYEKLTYALLCARLAVYMAEHKNVEACKNNIDKVSAILAENKYESAVLDYKEANVYYYALIEDREKFSSTIKEFLELVYTKEDYSRAESFLLSIYTMKEDDAFIRNAMIPYIKEGLKVIGDKGVYSNLYMLYIILIEYAFENDDNSLLFNSYKNLSKIYDKLQKDLNISKSESIDFFINLAKKRGETERLAAKNEKLNEIIIEEEVKNRELKSVYDQLRIITKLGQKITAAPDIYEMTKIIYEELFVFMKIDIVGIFADVVDNKFTISYMFSENKVEKDIELSIDDKTRLCSKVFRTKKHIISNYLEQNEDYIEANKHSFGAKKEHSKKSAIYYPIKKENDILGVLTIQSEQEGAYKPEDIAIIRAITPYIAIAINNNIRSKRLEKELKEIEKSEKVLKKLLEYNRELNYIDPLTKVFSRKYLNNNFKVMINKAKNEKKYLSAFMFDIDNFKKYNDLNGHPQGDKALISVANQIKGFFTAKDMLLARYGGEEFVGIAIDVNLEKAEKLAGKILKSVEHLGIRYESNIAKFVTVSIGLVSFKPNGKMLPNEVMKRVDDNLYKAKKHGKNCVVSSSIGESNDF